MKRSAKAKFMPNGIVFPGGAIEKCDSEPSWLSLFASMGCNESHFKAIASDQKAGSRPFIFDRLHRIHEGAGATEIERDISLRISAVRETFEELGILIAKTQQQLNDRSAADVLYSKAVGQFDVKKWQKEVKFNSYPFYVY